MVYAFISFLFINSFSFGKEWGPLAPSPLPKKMTSITGYSVKTERCQYQTRKIISLREFKKGNENFRWIVDESTLRTELVPTPMLSRCTPYSFNNNPTGKNQGPTSSYLESLRKYNQGPLQNAGLTNDETQRPGTFITVDLCPSKGSFDKAFFETLKQKQWPLGIAISGSWLLAHETEWQWLRNNFSDKQVLWINHSRHHFVQPDLPPEKNFLLLEGHDIKKEILDNEKLLIERGLTPSIFFRFPGLIANAKALAITRELGLIVIGSNAWLSKGATPKAGSIVLIHGNGNDPLGLSKFEELSKKHRFSEPFKDLLKIFAPQ